MGPHWATASLTTLDILLSLSRSKPEHTRTARPSRLRQAAAQELAATGLKTAGVAVETHARPGLGHGIDEVGIGLGRQFLTKCFG